MTIMELPSLIRSFTLIDDRRNNKNKRYPLPLLLSDRILCQYL